MRKLYTETDNIIRMLNSIREDINDDYLSEHEDVFAQVAIHIDSIEREVTLLRLAVIRAKDREFLSDPARSEVYLGKMGWGAYHRAISGMWDLPRESDGYRGVKRLIEQMDAMINPLDSLPEAETDASGCGSADSSIMDCLETPSAGLEAMRKRLDDDFRSRLEYCLCDDDGNIIEEGKIGHSASNGVAKK